MRGAECVYVESVAAGRRTLPRSEAAHTVTVESCRRPSSSLAFAASHADDGILPNGDFTFAYDLGMHDAQLQSLNGSKGQSFDLSVQRSPLKGFLNFDELFAFEDDTLDQQQCSADISLASYDNPDQDSGSWCTWMRGNVSLSVMTENPLVKLAVPQLGHPHAQHNADLIIQALRSFPTMMLRRETFPWFIHPRSQLLSKSTGIALPEALSNCMSIAQMFASQTSETRYFFRQTIGAEYRRFISEVRFCSCRALLMLNVKKMYLMSKFELLAAMQACMIYLIMYVIDYSPEDEGSAQKLLLALHASTALCS